MSTIDFQRFWESLQDQSPPKELSKALTGLWYDGSGDWETAHRVVQKGSGVDSAWVHAYLHRKEGDLANSGYWYRQCKKTIPKEPLTEEWTRIVRTLLDNTTDD